MFYVKIWLSGYIPYYSLEIHVVYGYFWYYIVPTLWVDLRSSNSVCICCVTIPIPIPPFPHSMIGILRVRYNDQLNIPPNPVDPHTCTLNKTHSSQSSNTKSFRVSTTSKIWIFLPKANPNWSNHLSLTDDDDDASFMHSSLTQNIQLLVYCSYIYHILVAHGLET